MANTHVIWHWLIRYTKRDLSLVVVRPFSSDGAAFLQCWCGPPSVVVVRPFFSATFLLSDLSWVLSFFRGAAFAKCVLSSVWRYFGAAFFQCGVCSLRPFFSGAALCCSAASLQCGLSSVLPSFKAASIQFGLPSVRTFFSSAVFIQCGLSPVQVSLV